MENLETFSCPRSGLYLSTPVKQKPVPSHEIVPLTC
jgi:hypothetical protein